MQAILPLRGKVLNTEQASNSKMNNNRELQDIVQALGCGMGNEFDIKKLRYHKIFLLMDADSDGNHITTLLLTFFFFFIPELIHKKHVYLAQPPLYRVTAGKNEIFWVRDDAELKKLRETKLKGKKFELSRFKGLGEMLPSQLKETTLDIKKRRALCVTVEDALAAETFIAELMGKKVDERRRIVQMEAAMADRRDLDV